MRSDAEWCKVMLAKCETGVHFNKIAKSVLFVGDNEWIEWMKTFFCCFLCRIKENNVKFAHFYIFIFILMGSKLFHLCTTHWTAKNDFPAVIACKCVYKKKYILHFVAFLHPCILASFALLPSLFVYLVLFSFFFVVFSEILEFYWNCSHEFNVTFIAITVFTNLSGFVALALHFGFLDLGFGYDYIRFYDVRYSQYWL